MRKLIIFLVVIVLLLVVVDRGGDVVAERLTADKLQTSQGLQQRPDVSIDGIPFITQFASGHYQHIEVDAQDVHVGTTSLYLSQLHADLRTITVSRSFDKVTAKTASANATVDYGDLSRLLKVRVHYGGGNTLALTKKLPLIGKKTVRFKASYANGALRFGQGAINGLGHIGNQVSSVLKKYFDVRTSLRNFPFDVRVRSISVDSGGLQFSLTGSNLSYGTN